MNYEYKYDHSKAYFQLGVLKAAIRGIGITARLPGLSYTAAELEQKLKSISHSVESAEGLIEESEGKNENLHRYGI